VNFTSGEVIAIIGAFSAAIIGVMNARKLNIVHDNTNSRLTDLTLQLKAAQEENKKILAEAVTAKERAIQDATLIESAANKAATIIQGTVKP
jgi:uncharacterized membrane-anchored protein